MSQSQQTFPESISGKEPWLAVNFSLIFPGIGQIYSGNASRGWLVLIAYLLLAGLGLGLLLLPAGNIASGFGFLLGNFLLNIWNLFDAHSCARRANSTSFEQLRKSGKDPWLAVLLSRIFPGIGHFYSGKILTGIVFLMGFLIFLVFLPYSIILIGYQFLAVWHAHTATPGQKRTSQKVAVLFIGALIILPLIISLPALALRSYVAEARYIPSGAMQPTLQINDRLIIDKLSYRFQGPQRGDIVVFSATETLQKLNFKDAFIKRVIGLPGETVAVKGGRVYINDKPLEENYIKEAPQYQYGPVKVPEGQYFVLGDNRNESYDSHYWGFVPAENMIGKATKRFWPPERVGPV